MLPEVARLGLADAVDAFCETIGFTAAQTGRLFQAATRAGLPVKLHAEQLSNQHGAPLPARFGALSADHLHYLDNAGVPMMPKARTVVPLLPGPFYFVRQRTLLHAASSTATVVSISFAPHYNPP